ncbi:MAG: hypothetical protein ABJN75_18340 [Hoeflea sp.]|uniref:hypothetical protein n=1 Tax=Hoeflea sp. TaxID=1940281 RepID=UPI003297B404
MKTPVKRHKGPAPRPANDNSNLRDRLRAARIGWSDAILGAIGWGAAMALSAQAAIWLSMAGLTDHYWSITALVFSGAVLAWPLSLACFRFIAFRRSREAVFAAAFVCLSIFTLGVTACLFAVIYRNFYAQWHGDPFTKLWLLQLAFTSAAALYQFAVIGVRLYLPLGVVFLFAASLMLAHGNGRAKPAKTGLFAGQRR